MVYLLKMLLCSAVLLGYYWVALRNERFHQWNRMYLLSAVILSLVVPFLEIPILPAAQVPMKEIVQRSLLTPTSQPEIVTASAAHATNGTAFNGNELLLAFYLAVGGVLFLKISQSVFQIIRLRHRYPAVNQGNFLLIETDLTSAPFSFFKWLFWRNDITSDQSELQSILNHELTHIHEGHSYDKLFMETIVALCWFNPFFWLIRHELTLIHEYHADQAAIKNGNTEAFSRMILSIHFDGGNPRPSHSLFSSSLEKRLKMISNRNISNKAFLRKAFAFPITTLLIFSLGVTQQKANAQKQEKKDTLNRSYDNKKIVAYHYDAPKSQVTLTLQDSSKVNMSFNEAKQKGYYPNRKTDAASINKGYSSYMKKIRLTDLPSEDQQPHYLIAKTQSGECIKFGVMKGKEVAFDDIITLITMQPTDKNIKLKAGEPSGLTAIETSFSELKAGTKAKQVLYMVDGKKVAPEMISSIKPQQLKITITYTAAEVLNKYGANGYNVAIDVRTEKKQQQTGMTNSYLKSVGQFYNNFDDYEFRVNGKPAEKATALGIASNLIRSTNVLAPVHAAEKYGADSKSGIVEIETWQ